MSRSESSTKGNYSIGRAAHCLRQFPLAPLALSVALLSACSETSDNTSPVQASPLDSATVQGAAVKGPVVGGEARIYLLDFSAPDLKGELIASGSTDDKGALQDLELGGEHLRELSVLLEVSGGKERSGVEPVVTVLRSIITPWKLEDGSVFATPMTTMIIAAATAAADLSAPELATENFVAALDTQSENIKSYFGLGLLSEGASDIDPFTASPLPAEDGSISEAALNYRTVNEVMAALIAEIAAGASVDDVLQAIGTDIADGDLDGMSGGAAVAGLQSIKIVDMHATLTQDASVLLAKDIPGIPGTPIAELSAEMVKEAKAFTGATVTEPSVPAVEKIVPGDDSDGDGVVDAIDNLPNNPDETVDSDNDGVGDNSDACDGPGSVDADGDGTCDDPAADPLDIFPNDPDRAVLTDNDTPVAVISNVDVNTYTNVTIVPSASTSTDGEDDSLTAQWELAAPNSSSAQLTGEPLTFVTDVAGDYTLTLVVSDGWAESAPVTFTTMASVPQGNVAPSAEASADALQVGVSPNAGITQVVAIGASNSSDANGDELTYDWVVTGPSGAAVTVVDATNISASFTAADAGDYDVELTVNDGNLQDVANLTVEAVFLPGAPVSDPGADEAIDYAISGVTIDLDGSASSDVDGDNLSYRWEFVSTPRGTNEDYFPLISNATSQSASFDVLMDIDDEIGNYTVRLTVTDDSDSMLSDSEDIVFSVEKPWKVTSGALFGAALVSFAFFAIPARRRQAARKRQGLE